MKTFALCLTTMALALTAACTKNQTPSSEGGKAASETAATSGPTIRVGEVGSMTGEQATFGQSTHDGVMLAAKIVNAAGGIHGKQIEIKSLDDQGKPDEAATAVTKLITQDNVSAILGEVASSVSLAMAPIAQEKKIPMITPSSTNPKVTEMGDYIFRTCFIDPFQGTVMARFALEHLKVKKVAILRDVKNAYSVGLADFFKETYTQGGGTIVMDQSYSAGDITFKAQLTAIRGQNPEAIFVPGYYGDVSQIMKQARQLGIQVPLMGGDGWDSPKLTEGAGTASNNSYFSNHYSNEDKAPVIQEFIAKFKAEYGGRSPDGLSAAGYDAAMVLFDSMKRAKNLTPTEIRDAIAATKDHVGVTGKITLNSKRDAVKSAVVLKVDGGQFKYVTTINP